MRVRNLLKHTYDMMCGLWACCVHDTACAHEAVKTLTAPGAHINRLYHATASTTNWYQLDNMLYSSASMQPQQLDNREARSAAMGHTLSSNMGCTS